MDLEYENGSVTAPDTDEELTNGVEEGYEPEGAEDDVQ
jgi:hypothetical protein